MIAVSTFVTILPKARWRDTNPKKSMNVQIKIILNCCLRFCCCTCFVLLSRCFCHTAFAHKGKTFIQHKLSDTCNTLQVKRWHFLTKACFFVYLLLADVSAENLPKTSWKTGILTIWNAVKAFVSGKTFSRAYRFYLTPLKRLRLFILYQQIHRGRNLPTRESAMITL